jgi:hypothetical protein
MPPELEYRRFGAVPPLAGRENRKIGFRPKGFEGICVHGSPGTSLLPRVPIQIFGKQIGIAYINGVVLSGVTICIVGLLSDPLVIEVLGNLIGQPSSMRTIRSMKQGLASVCQPEHEIKV